MLARFCAFVLAFVFVCLAVARSARADPPGQTLSVAADRDDGADTDASDTDDDGDVAPAVPAADSGAARSTPGGRAQSWVGVTAFSHGTPAGRTDVGAMLMVGAALDRIGGAPAPAGPPATDDAPDAPSGSGAPSARNGAPGVLPPWLARQCVAAAWRTSGLGVDDARLDATLSRSRASAWLPEARVRGMRLLSDAAHATTLATTDGTTYYDAVGANLVLEVRLTWRFDRLLYAGDEPSIERLRLEHYLARTRLAERTLDALFSWRRALADVASALEGSRDEGSARLRASEARATLDVLTGGWFSARGAPLSAERPPPPPPP